MYAAAHGRRRNVFENKKESDVISSRTALSLRGQAFGADGSVVGEIVFTTAMVGYQETLTDPSYCGQIVTQTFPLIGNYGVNSVDPESNGSVVSGYIVREQCEDPSNFRCEGDLDSYLKKYNIIGDLRHRHPPPHKDHPRERRNERRDRPRRLRQGSASCADTRV